MNRKIRLMIGLALAVVPSIPLEAKTPEERPRQWRMQAPVLLPGEPGTFDETAVKDPSIVLFKGSWHLFYTARGRGEYTTAHVTAKTLDTLQTAPRHELVQIHGRTSRYACAPQVFFFRPHRRWYLICQTRDANYQPAYATTDNIECPQSWSGLEPFLVKDELAKWIDFWVICDDDEAFLFYTRDHRDVYLRTTSLTNFPHGWSDGVKVFTGVHEAVHIYKAIGRQQYHMIYERDQGGAARSGWPSPTVCGDPGPK